MNLIGFLIRANTGGYFQLIKTAKVKIYVTVSRIEKNKWKESLPLVEFALYELKQMFVKKFYGQKHQRLRLEILRIPASCFYDTLKIMAVIIVPKCDVVNVAFFFLSIYLSLLIILPKQKLLVFATIRS